MIDVTTRWGLTPSPDRMTLLAVRSNHSGSGLMLVESFR